MHRQLRPQYAKGFHCIGPECEDTCCQGWDIVVDRDAYERFKPIESLKSQLVVISYPTNAEHARIQMTASCTCPFLTADGWCGIQQKYGENYLPDICANYPKPTQKIDGLKETTLMLACPEAARMVVLNPNLIQPEEAGVPRYQRFSQPKPVPLNGSPHQFLWDLRAFSLLLLRDWAYPLWQRLFLLGIFCKRLHELSMAKQLELVPELLNEHSAMIAEGKLRSSMDGIPARTGLQLATVLEIINRHLATTAGKHPRFRECIKDFLAGIHCAEGMPIESCASSFEENNVRYCAPFLEKHPYMLENFLINYVLRTRFPYGIAARDSVSDPLMEFLMMCILYALVKGLLVGMSGLLRENFDANHIVKVVQSVSKSVEQCPKFPLNQYASLANTDGFALLLKSDC